VRGSRVQRRRRVADIPNARACAGTHTRSGTGSRARSGTRARACADASTRTGDAFVADTLVRQRRRPGLTHRHGDVDRGGAGRRRLHQT
jgi:hypothetical protein